MRIGFKKSFYDGMMKSFNELNKLQYFKKKLIEILDRQEQKENRISKALEEYDMMQKAGFGIGTVREWNEKKFRKIAPGKWRRIYSSNERGINVSIANVKKAINNAKDFKELGIIVSQNIRRFYGEDGKLIPVAQQILDEAKRKQSNLKNNQNDKNKIMTVTKTVEFAKGVELKITGKLEHIKYHIDEDIWELRPEENVDKWEYSFENEFTMNGKSDTDVNYVDYDTEYYHKHPDLLELQKIPENVKGRLVCFKTNNIINLKKETNDKVKSAIEEAKKELATEESKKYFAEEKSKNETKEIEDLEKELEKNQKVIEECEKEIKENGKLQFETIEDVKKYMNGLNNVLNEGGEGYLPKPPLCNDNYKYALKRVEELKAALKNKIFMADGE